jgi:hypothetical protein
LSAPAWAGLIALVNEGRVASGQATLNRVTPTDTQQALYSLSRSDFHPIAGGGNGTQVNASYNLVTGLGTPVANRLVPGLIAYEAPATTHAGPSASPLEDGTLASGAWSHGASTTGGFNVFSALTTTGSSFSEVLRPDASLATSRAASRVNLRPPLAATTTSVAALGPPFALSIGSRSIHGPAQSLSSIADSTSAGVTSAPLVGVASSSFSTGLGPQLPVWSPPWLAVISPSAQEHEGFCSEVHRWNLDADAFVLGMPRRGLVAQSVLDDVAASLLLSRGRDGAAPASVPTLPPTGVTGTVDAMAPGLQQDQDAPSATSAVGLVVFGLAAGAWARRSGILNARKRQRKSRTSRSKSHGLTPGKEPWLRAGGVAGR